MIRHRRGRLIAALMAAGAMALASCSAVDDSTDGQSETSSSVESGDSSDSSGGESGDSSGDTSVDTSADSEASDGTTDTETDAPSDGGDTAATEIKFDKGVTKEACPDAVNPDNGCIYLGVLSDLTDGPFAALAVPIVNGQRAYWKMVNENGGIDGFDVDIDTYTRDTHYDAAKHAAAYQQIRGDILAIAQSLGTVNTEAVLDDMDADNMVAVPTTWWSGWAFSANDKGLVVENGYSYCTESMIGLDWVAENVAMPTSVAAVGYPGDYGGDSAAGVKMWAEVNGVEDVTVIPTGPNQVTGNQDAVVAAVKEANPDAVVLAIGPAETAEIVGKLAAGGFTGQFMGSLPTWNPALLKSAAAPALEALYHHMSPSEQWDGTSDGAKAMKASMGGEMPKNGGYVIGWQISYPMHALLQKAADNGDLTRAALRAAVDGLTVTYDGMLHTVTFGGEGKDVAASVMKVYKPDPNGPLGESATGDFFSGTTFAQVPYDKACSSLG